MKPTSPLFSLVSTLGRAVVLLSAGLAVTQVAPALRAQIANPAPLVTYTPELTQIQGVLPVTRSFNVSIVAPANLVAGVSLPISFVVTPNGIPAGVTSATAIGYLSFSTPGTGTPLTSLTFNAPNQVVSFTVTLAVPIGAIPGSYGYKILATGWSIDPSLGLTNVGTFIQATVTAAAAYTPPVVVIATPVDGSVITVTPTAFPLSVPFQFQSTSTGANASAISEVTANADGVQLTLSSNGLNTVTATSAATLTITGPGSHTVTATAKNLGGSASDVNSFTVVTTVPPPTVVINSPTPNSVYTYRVGSAATVVPFAFTANSNFGGILTLTAKVDNTNVPFTATGLGTLQAAGTINLPYTTAGTHTVSVTTTDNYGTAVASSNFTVNVVAPTPAITISQPTAGASFTAAAGSTTVNVPYTFVATSNNGFFVDSVTASLDGNTIVIGSIAGLGTATATSTGTLVGVTAGSHTLVVKGVSAGIEVSTSTTFTVIAVLPPPTVVINTPAAGSVFTRVSGSCAPLSIPLTFTGTSTPSGGVITQLKASLNGTNLSVASTTLGQRVATGSATMSVTNAGTYTISVTAIDAYGTANTTRTFSVVVVQPRTVYGSIFFDVDGDGNYDCEDFDLSCITVKLLDATGAVIATDTTECEGDYSFCNIGPGTYTVRAEGYAGLKVTTAVSTITVSNADVCVPPIGFNLDFTAIRTMTAAGQNVAFWKYNLDNGTGCNGNGGQIGLNTLWFYTCRIGNFASCSYDQISMKQASNLMGSTSTNSCSQLSKELIASEYNYQRCAYINGNRNLTFLFLWWGENVLENPNKYGASYTLWAKSWFAAYNNSNGGTVAGPSP